MKEIPLTMGKVALVDDEDYVALACHKWHALKEYKTPGVFYAVRNRIPQEADNKSLLRMHRVIMNPAKGMEVDHINGNGLDNRRENLRIVTHRQNGQNRHQVKSSKYPGVSWDKRHRKWQSLIQVKGKRRGLGYFENELDASTTYQVACAVLGRE